MIASNSIGCSQIDQYNNMEVDNIGTAELNSKTSLNIGHWCLIGLWLNHTVPVISRVSLPECIRGVYLRVFNNLGDKTQQVTESK